uniref:Coiled-coil serine-rich protein 2b n=1 Tax=Astyanax mexicanus TaxID=7994 RepID=W5LGN8_ASTMX
MEDTALKQPTMVSRLPKFGSRAAPASAGPLSNGSALPVSSVGGKGVPVGKQNGIIRVPPTLSTKWKKGRDDSGEKIPDAGEEPRMGVRTQQQPRSAAMIRDFGKPSAAPVGKARRSIPTATSTNPRTIPQSTRANPRTTAPKNPSQNQSMYSRRAGMNGIGSGLPKPGSSSSLSQSSDSLKSVSVEHVVRSQSFSQLKSSTTPASPPLTRSFSFNRAAELAKEMPRPLAQSPLARSPVTQPSLVLAGERPGPFGVAKSTISTNTSSSLPPASLKKSLLPNCSSSKPSAISYKLMRPSLIKQPRSALSGKVQVKAGSMQRDAESQETVPTTSDISSNTESAETTPDDPKESDGLQVVSLEIPEDMSMSSTSSLERNDISEEYMDDFDDLGSGVRIQLYQPIHDIGNGQSGFEGNALVSQCQEGSSVTSLHSFLSETVDWAEMGLTGAREGLDVSPRKMSSGGDLPHGSSLDLSPSDSSGGTYMWDEEVLEPLGGATHRCGSYDSELNSMDILNNLENLESCDLEDDDLMLDVDLPEDASLHNDVDGVSHYDCSESGFWPGQWRRRQQLWGRSEQLNNNNRAAVLPSFDDCHLKGLGRRGSGHGSLDELMLKHMAQDCSSVKEQLLQLRRLLQIEEDGSVDESLELDSSLSSEETNCQQQVEELLKEVQNLREELREKERLISKLSQQMAAQLEVPQCHCLQGEPLSQGQQDKSTQTPWRVQNPQILQPSRPLSRSSGHHKLERPSSKVLTGAHSDSVDAKSGDCPVKVQPCASTSRDSTTSNIILSPLPEPATAPASAATVSPTVPATSSVTLQDIGPDELHQLLDTHLTISDLHSPRVRTSNVLLRIGDPLSPGVQVNNCVQLLRGDCAPNDLHSLQPLSYIKRATALMRHRDSSQINLGRGFLGRAGRQQACSSNTSRTRHMPPPSRGFPCISSASQVAASTNFSAHNVHFRGLRPNQAPRDMEQSSARARELPQPCNSRLPKPKSH